ncbi:unnamed protein product, partial [Staurois parvus]
LLWLPGVYGCLLELGWIKVKSYSTEQGRTDNSWGPRAIGDHGAPVSLPKLKKAYEKFTGASHEAPY